MVNHEPLIFAVLLTLRTSPYQKSMEPLELQLDCTTLRTMVGFHDSHSSFLFQQSFGQYLTKLKFFLAMLWVFI